MEKWSINMTMAEPDCQEVTLETLAEVFFYSKPLPASKREQFTALFTSNQIRSGAKSGFFILPNNQNGTRPRLFSGEAITTAFAFRHLQLIESARLLRLLQVNNRPNAESIQLADQRMNSTCYAGFCSKGECKILTIAYMRYLATNLEKEAESKLASFLQKLSMHRDGKGQWGSFPYFYTLLMLSESLSPLACAELRYTVGHRKKISQQVLSSGSFASRRQAILIHALGRI
jgi:hypothetical protein